jgi:hypothetical protein
MTQDDLDPCCRCHDEPEMPTEVALAIGAIGAAWLFGPQALGYVRRLFGGTEAEPARS